eukprot:TRINITY_DN38547_c0_g1_i1.p1 TRINITY_DN38547_c0_g1~~TRINITY_DN38547_c0_g1_i1.p1  ORF type:complete len:441 (+),score=59.63 TRINITY_DN38547_c0_g1_i1:66-1325(+)
MASGRSRSPRLVRTSANKSLAELARRFKVATNKSLAELARQFRVAAARGHILVPDVGDASQKISKQAVDGTLLEAKLGKRIPFADAIIAALPAIEDVVKHALATYPKEVPHDFDTSKWKDDFVKAVEKLKEGDLRAFRTVDFENIRNALNKGEHLWHRKSYESDTVVILEFCIQVLELSAKLGLYKQAITNDLADKPERQRYSSPYPLWPHCTANDVDWVGLFGPEPVHSQDWDDSSDSGPTLTPRMACCIHRQACYEYDTLKDSEADGCPFFQKTAKPYWEQSAAWRCSYVECYARIAMRLEKGLMPTPNCTGEEVALRNILNAAEGTEHDYEEYHSLPVFPNDTNFDLLREELFEDDDVNHVFRRLEKGQGNLDHMTLLRRLDAYMNSDVAQMMAVGNLHPEEWFDAFYDERVNDHL